MPRPETLNDPCSVCPRHAAAFDEFARPVCWLHRNVLGLAWSALWDWLTRSEGI